MGAHRVKVTNEHQEESQPTVQEARFQKGEIICRSTEPNNYLYRITKGTARYISLEFSTPTTLCLAGAGDWIGVQSYKAGKTIETVIACDEVLAEAISVEEAKRRKINLSDLNVPSFDGLNGAAEAEYALGKILAFDEYQKYKEWAETRTSRTKPPGLVYYIYENSSGIDSGCWSDNEARSKEKGCWALAFDKEGLCRSLSSSDGRSHDLGLRFDEANKTAGEDEKEQQRERDVNSIYSLKQQIRFLAKELGVGYSADAVNRTCDLISEAELDGDPAAIESFLFSIGINVSRARLSVGVVNRLNRGSIVFISHEPRVVIGQDNKSVTVLRRDGKGYESIDIFDIDSKNGYCDIFYTYKSTGQSPERFGLMWLWPYVKEHRSTLALILLTSFIIQVLGLAGPLLVQVIVDKAISQRSLDTLQILGAALLVVTIFEGLLGTLRSLLFTEVTNRIDIVLSSSITNHLFRLPLNYFGSRHAGELSSRFQETEKIRRFITDQAMTTILDGLFSLIYIVVMIAYSALLTVVALSVLPLQIAITILGSPVLRKTYREAAIKNAQSQSELVEGVTGIQTIKSQCLESKFRSRWQNVYSGYLRNTFKTSLIATGLSESSELLQNISQLLVLWIGAAQVLNGDITLGQLIAFRIIAGYVTQPILRLSSTWQSVQEVKVSFDRLGDILNTEQEGSLIEQKKPPMKTIEGGIELASVYFKFDRNSPRSVLNNVCLKIEKGSFVAVIGRSGSGKSTLVKLITRMYEPTHGSIRVDGTDIRKVELYSLRNQIGVVPQDCLLFTGTVADNIRIRNEEISIEEVRNAAIDAEADDFIMDLEYGYATEVVERGSSLSGGQRQRIAIARALINKPRLLVFDEATSALDYSTERAICNNLIKRKNRPTTLFVTHRIKSIQSADLIVVMEDGRIAEVGTHQELINQKGIYLSLLGGDNE